MDWEKCVGDGFTRIMMMNSPHKATEKYRRAESRKVTKERIPEKLIQFGRVLIQALSVRWLNAISL
ncbi:hypothetical protein OAG76_05410, partial [Rubripirellula sp.]|nr:hypothetical protein [Rubripirellula sp.]